MENSNFHINHRAFDLQVGKIPQTLEHENLLHIFYKASVRNVFPILLFDLWIFLQPSIRPNISVTDDCDYDIQNCKNRFLRIVYAVCFWSWQKKATQMDFPVVKNFSSASSISFVRLGAAPDRQINELSRGQLKAFIKRAQLDDYDEFASTMPVI